MCHWQGYLDLDLFKRNSINLNLGTANERKHKTIKYTFNKYKSLAIKSSIKMALQAFKGNKVRLYTVITTKKKAGIIKINK